MSTDTRAHVLARSDVEAKIDKMLEVIVALSRKTNR
jgi:hypothetical protein